MDVIQKNAPRMLHRKVSVAPKQAPTDQLSCREVCCKIIVYKDLTMVRIGIAGIGFMGMIPMLTPLN
jgi:hypothetical protein